VTISDVFINDKTQTGSNAGTSDILTHA